MQSIVKYISTKFLRRIYFSLLIIHQMIKISITNIAIKSFICDFQKIIKIVQRVLNFRTNFFELKLN